MKNLMIYGKPPFIVVVIHGGPGAPGEMAPVARELAYHYGILEPLQTELSIEGQIQELRSALKEHGDLPVTLVGHSWGARLGLIFTARHPSFVKKMILIGSGPFEEKYASVIMDTRLSRLNNKERIEAVTLADVLAGSRAGNRDEALARFGELIFKSDTFDPLPAGREEGRVACQYEVY